MRLILIGCEYAGKTTLAAAISRWLEQQMGRGQFGPYEDRRTNNQLALPWYWHDHFVRPFAEGANTDEVEDANVVLAMKPSLLDRYSRYMIVYHFHELFYQDNHHLLVNWYYGDAVYAPLYYGYGGPDAHGDASARGYDSMVMRRAPDTVLVLLKADPDVILQRKGENPHRWCILKDEDVEYVLKRFEEEFNRSLIRRRFVLDTSTASPEETFQNFLLEMQPHFSDRDRLAWLGHAGLQ